MVTTRRNSPRKKQSAKLVQTKLKFEPKNRDDESDDDGDDGNVSDAEEDAATPRRFEFQGVVYDSYEQMVQAKRKRNQEMLKNLGLDNPSILPSKKQATTTAATQRGIKRQTAGDHQQEPRAASRRSKRLAGESTSHVALDYNINWNVDTKNAMVSLEGGQTLANGEAAEQEKSPETFFKGRANDGSPLTLEDAIELNDPKWVSEDSLANAQAFFQTLSETSACTGQGSTTAASPTSVVAKFPDQVDVQAKLDSLSIDNEEWVAKVTPDRIYSVSAHPSESRLFVGAGDKSGYVGLWDVDAVAKEPEDSVAAEVHLFRPHTRPVCCMEWASPEKLITASYDGTIRSLHVESGVFTELFATYDDTDSYYAEELGFGMDQGYRYWTQFVTTDHRSSGLRSDPCLFVSTSVGTAFHLDLRSPASQKVTFHEKLSELKLNTLSLHPNGTTIASAGNDGTVRLWDVRKFSKKISMTPSTMPKPIAQHAVGRSVNSSMFSPSGKYLLSTSQADRLDLIENPQTLKGTIKPTTSIRHNNQTGRWLTTFMAPWHPSLDVFVTGSMKQPRRMEVFDGRGNELRAVTGDALSSVMSRCCFHNSTEKLTMIGGNSSGRVVAIR